ncbi:caspase family protein [Bradyrhizobium jicamae]|uniref:Caspase family protein n=1 Tax=Bradyrhizobium jicamae TaxID=280332 RepID=A0ABS5FV80_9BRAD|nr:caspase family protein [Bradyrhizobium jicamae]MBR0800699.1 caspase family protein [Bradyrhizobium jicamae]MBR0936632.1 caspase family protein [Bradyrhizobium jicamae]
MTAIRLALVSVFVALVAEVAFAGSGPRLYLRNPDGGSIRALIIGIDAYQHVRPLKGSVADARDIEGALHAMGTADVVTLIDGDANRTNILQNISALVQRTNPNDQIILSIAGHGAQEPETTKGSEPDGMQDVFVLPGFEPTAEGSKERILGSEFNHFIRQFELRGAKVLFVADTCHGGGLARDIDPRAAEMSFRQVPTYRLAVDKLTPVTNTSDPATDLDLDNTIFLAAVDRNTKAPEVKVPSIEGLRGALSYAVARALEGGADADHDGIITLKELFSNVRQVVYQLSDQRQNIVTKTSRGLPIDRDVMFQLTPSLPLPSTARQQVALANPNAAAGKPSSFPSTPSDAARTKRPPPIRLAALDGNSKSFPIINSRETSVEIVQPLDNPDLIWDPKSHDVISWGDVIAYTVDPGELATIVDRTAAIRELKRIATKSPQSLRVAPDDSQHRNNEQIQIELTEVAGRSVILFDISGDGTVQMLYPLASDEEPMRAGSLSLPLRVRTPFGAEQVVAVSTTQRLVDLEQALLQLNQRKAPGQIIKVMTTYLPSDARVGSIAFFTAP